VFLCIRSSEIGRSAGCTSGPPACGRLGQSAPMAAAGNRPPFCAAVGTLPLFLQHSADCLAAEVAANPAKGAGRPDRVLVIRGRWPAATTSITVVALRNDGLLRRPARRSASSPPTHLKADRRFGLHPSMAGFQEAVYAGARTGHFFSRSDYPKHNRPRISAAPTSWPQTAEPEGDTCHLPGWARALL